MRPESVHKDLTMKSNKTKMKASDDKLTGQLKVANINIAVNLMMEEDSD